jgi:hypothetical protein
MYLKCRQLVACTCEWHHRFVPVACSSITHVLCKNTAGEAHESRSLVRRVIIHLPNLFIILLPNLLPNLLINLLINPLPLPPRKMLCANTLRSAVFLCAYERVAD